MPKIEKKERPNSGDIHMALALALNDNDSENCEFLYDLLAEAAKGKYTIKELTFLRGTAAHGWKADEDDVVNPDPSKDAVIRWANEAMDCHGSFLRGFLSALTTLAEGRAGVESVSPEAVFFTLQEMVRERETGLKVARDLLRDSPELLSADIEAAAAKLHTKPAV
jgi:hypothetical protein